MNEREIHEIIIKYCTVKDDKRYLTCDAAFQIAQELNIDVSIIGSICNSYDIKIRSCRLKCF